MNNLVVLIGPTAVGKTATSFAIAEHFECPIISADSRQMYRGMEIGTAMPTKEELARHKHYFVGQLAPGDYYSAARYETDVLELLEEEFPHHPTMLLTGGSMMYIDAVCNGIDDIPTVSAETRAEAQKIYEEQGLEGITAKLKELDPVWYEKVDLKNHRRVMHAVEVCLFTGKPYSSFLSGEKKKRDFEIEKIGLERPREELYDRINKRVDIMIADGLEEEARKVYHLRHLNSLNTVGFKEMFAYFDGEISRERAIELIKQNSRHYAKRQMTWFRGMERRGFKINWLPWDMPKDKFVDAVIKLL